MQSCHSVADPRKVPPSGKVVNDIGQTALSRPACPRGARWIGAEFAPGLVRIPTKPRFFLVYQKSPAAITMAGTATESRKRLLPKIHFRRTGWLQWIRLIWLNTREP